MRTFAAAALAALALSLAPTAAAQGALVTNDPSLCLSVEGRNVYTRSCTPSKNVFQAVYQPRNAFVIRANGGCLDAYRGAGQPVEVVGCDGSKEQDWFLNGTGQIQNQRYPSLCLDVERGLGSGRRVLAYQCDFNGNERARAANQRFYFGSVRVRQSSDRTVSAPSGGIAGSSFAGTGFRGAALIGHAGGNVIAVGGGNVIAVGGGNVISTGGLN